MQPRSLRIVAGGVLFLVLAGTGCPAQTYFTLHSFSTNSEGRPGGGVVFSGTSLYGTAPQGGTKGLGELFKVNTDGTGFAVVKGFTGGDGGQEPWGGLVLSGTTLYGTTYSGGTSNFGTIFKVNTDGRGFAVLKSFAGGDDAANPYAGLVLSGATLFGWTGSGGISNKGTLFKINTDGSGYAVLKRFAGGSDGQLGYGGGDLVMSATTIYGVTGYDYASNNGEVLYKINTDGSGYAVLRYFTNSSKGLHPAEGLALSGTTLYGSLIPLEDFTNNGTLFKVNTDGGGYTVLKKFTGDDGVHPVVSLLSDTKLYGVVYAYNRSRTGLFTMNLDGTGYNILHQFTNVTEGTDPNSGLALSGGTLYGTTRYGGNAGNGVVFGLVFQPTSPGIFAAPQSQTVPTGSSVSFVAGAFGAPTLTYQWFLNGRPIGSASTNSGLTVANVTLADSGNYTVTVTNGFGSVTSAPARLDVIAKGDTTVRTCTERALRLALNEGTNVTFACDGTVTLGSTIIISTNTVLDANGHQVTISGNGLVQVFQVNSNVNCALIGLTIADGFAYGLSSGGGGILNSGTLILSNCVFLRNAAYGAPAPDYVSPAMQGGPGCGGAIYNLGVLNADQCSFLQNSCYGGSGSDGPGLSSGQISFFERGGIGGEALGGAVWNFGQLFIRRTLFASNSVTGGRGGYGLNGQVSGDITGNGADGGPGANGTGAALFNSGAGGLVDCTFCGNVATGGEGGGGGSGCVSGGGGSGGGGWGTIYSTNAFVQATNCTVARNYAKAGNGGQGGAAVCFPRAPGNNGSTKGAFATAGAAVVNTIVANNSPSNCYGAITDLGHNLSSDSSCVFTHYGSFNNVDARLAPLADNGGPTLTMALLPGSPAIDGGDATAAASTDQRGAPRPAGPAPDIGAYEYGSLQLIHIGRLESGMCALTLREVSAPSCRLFTTTDFLQWSPITTNRVAADGTAVFQVPVDLSEAVRFYRAAVP